MIMFKHIGDSCRLETCPNDGQQWSCHNEIRIHGSQVWIDKSCKQKHSCEMQAAQNNANYGGTMQCNPWNRMNSGKLYILLMRCDDILFFQFVGAVAVVMDVISLMTFASTHPNVSCPNWLMAVLIVKGLT